jgi:biuret amidohydrolase
MTTTMFGDVVTNHVPDTRPYPWPYDGLLDLERLALLVVGAQRWWASRTDGVDAVPYAVARLRAAGVRTVFVVHTGRRPGYLPEPGSAEAELVVEPAGDDVVVGAAGLDGCYGGPLVPTLRSLRVDRLLVAGLGLAGPVHSTLRGLNDRGFECLLVADACGSEGAETRDGAIGAILESGGIFGAVGTTAAVLAALTRKVRR